MVNKDVPVNATTAYAAEMAVRRELPVWGIAYDKLVVFPRAEGSLPDDQVAITVTKPEGPRTTLIVRLFNVRRVRLG